jgi:hypothetical protein
MQTGVLFVIVPRRLRAPREDRVVLALPPLAEAGALLDANRQRVRSIHLEILGRTFYDLRLQAIKSAAAAAVSYLQRAGEPVPTTDTSSLIMAGHQPELFHPGVWVKNFALNNLARLHHATPVNLVVDNDTVKTTVLRVPSVDALAVSPVSVPFDRWTTEIPYEERHVIDEEMFAELPKHAAEITGPWNFTPLLPEFWAYARAQAQRTPLLGDRLAAARRWLERSWGCHNLEVPVSSICQTEPFAWFACHLIANLPRFHEIHNTCVHEYRHLYGIRSHSHPVPDLAREGEWLEVPFWAWRSERPRRSRLLVRLGADRIDLRAGDERWPSLHLPPSANPRGAVARWQQLEREGFKIRSRALTNTIYARLFLADVFIHGIGGAKYDELTDELIRRFYRVEPPGYLVISATLLLPLPAVSVCQQDCRHLAEQLRDLHYNPQRHLDGYLNVDDQSRRLASRKLDWIERQPRDARERRERFQALRYLTEQLRQYVAPEEIRARQDLERCEANLKTSSVRQRRDYALCLYPESTLRPFCTQFLGELAGR